MRRNAACVALCTLIVILPGCANKKKNADASLSGGYDPYAYSAPTETPRYEPRSVPTMDTTTYAAPAESTWATPVSESESLGGGRYHTVAKGDTLFSLARQYYGNQSKWKEIYQANRTTLADPNKIRVGQRLLIP